MPDVNREISAGQQRSTVCMPSIKARVNFSERRPDHHHKYSPAVNKVSDEQDVGEAWRNARAALGLDRWRPESRSPGRVAPRTAPVPCEGFCRVCWTPFQYYHMIFFIDVKENRVIINCLFSVFKVVRPTETPVFTQSKSSDYS